MAETLLPSVRGRTRLTVAALTLTASTVAGALVGLASAVLALPLRWAGAWLPVADPARPIEGGWFVGAEATVGPVVATAGRPLVLGLLAVGLALDSLRLVTGRVKPPALGRQVPREWGRWLRPEVVAVLYGTRLGIGPSTMLSTWTWWSVTVGAALVGPGTAAATGACFGLVRILVTIAVSSRLVAPSPSPSSAPLVAHPSRPVRPWFAAAGRHTKASWAAVDAAVLAVAVSFLVAGCADGSPEAAPTTTTVPAVGFPAPADDPAGVGPDTGEVGSGAIASLTDPRLIPPPTTPAQLEDFVRLPSSTPTTPSTPSNVIVAPPPASPETLAGALAGTLVATVPGFEPVTDPGADRFLDLDAASRLQPDPVAETALLQTRGFAGGWTRAFRSPANDVAVASVYEFESAAEAEFYLEDGLILIGGYGGRFFDIPALPGVRGFHQQVPGDAGEAPLTVLGAAFQTGPRWYLVYLLGSEATVTPDTLIDLVTAQVAAATVS